MNASVEAEVEKSPFVRRHNADGTWDSICLKCLLTAVYKRIGEDHLAEYERMHRCGYSDLR